MDGTGRKVLFLILAAFFFSAAVLIGIYPYRPNSLSGWVILYLVSLPLAILFEVSGTIVFSKGVSSRLNRIGRTFYGVIVLCFVLFVAMGVDWIEPFLGKWN